ncbi:MAG: hypothetical protein K2G23_05825, partial [Muribaculaceae bacterium]|nr:hypothetical protein [Muribaculaceae bacterium]
MIDLFLAKGSEEPNEWGGVTLYTDEPFVSIKNVPFAGEQWEWVEFELPEPYQIVEGEPFYAGWGFLNTNDENAPLVADNIPNDNLASSWMEGYEPQDPYYGYWNNCTTAGANCIRLRIAGETLPSDDAVITGIEVPRRIYPDKAFDVSITVSNAASSEIKELEIQYCFPEGEKQKEIVSGLSIPAGEKDKVELKNIKTTNWGNIQLDIEILSVNGKKDADYSNNMISAYILNLPEDMGFDRKILVEEGTGTWCGNCPRGIVGMRQMAEKYPEKFIGVAAHYSDRMQIEAYQPYLNRYIDIVGYPYSTIDRVISCDPEFNELEENFLREMEIPSLAEISIEDMSIIGDMAYVNPTVKFAISEDNTEYGWAYVVTEDNVGPYNQTNYYTDGSLSGWDFSENPVNIYYDEVAVGAAHILGKNALPASIEAEKTYSLPMTFDVPGVQNWDNAHLIVMVLNMKTGYIENAVRKSFAQNSIKGI